MKDHTKIVRYTLFEDTGVWGRVFRYVHKYIRKSKYQISDFGGEACGRGRSASLEVGGKAFGRWRSEVGGGKRQCRLALGWRLEARAKG